MRILHVIGSIAPRLGGPSRAILEMSAALARIGHDVEVVTTTLSDRGSWLPVGNGTKGGGPTPRRVRQGDYHVTYCAPGWPTRWVTSWEMLAVLRQRIPHADVVHIHSLYLFPTWAASRIARADGIPYVVRPHGTLDPNIRRRHRLLKRLYQALIENATLSHAAAIHFTTTAERDLALPVLPEGVRTAVIPLGVDLQRFETQPGRDSARAALGIDPQATVWAFVGRLHGNKGIDLLTSGFIAIAKRFANARLIVAGPDDDGLGARLLQECRKHGVVDRVQVLGFLDDGGMQRVLAAADFWILPSYSDSFGLAVVEAMAARLPVLITDRVNISHAVLEAGAGVVVQANAASILEGMISLAGLSPGERVAMGRRGRALCERSFSWDRTAEGLSALYEDVGLP